MGMTVLQINTLDILATIYIVMEPVAGLMKIIWGFKGFGKMGNLFVQSLEGYIMVCARMLQLLGEVFRGC